MNKEQYQHWYHEEDEQKIVWLTLDRKNSSTNTINGEVLEELKSFLMTFKNGYKPRALIIQSGKKNGFIAGTDILQFKHIKSTEFATNLVRTGQTVFDLLESMPFPTIAAISGFCLGGGCELVLACRYRIAIDDPKMRIGLPEVLLGLHPGWGGTVRLPKLIGSLKAMDLILSGRTLDARSAKKMGLVDAVVPERQFTIALIHYALNSPEPKDLTTIESLTNQNFVRPLLGKLFRKQVSKKVRQKHYPAPYAAIDHWEEHGVEGEKAYISEVMSFSRLLVSPTTQNLVRIFFLRDNLKGLTKGYELSVNHVHVIGAGVMGGDIAAWCALRGFKVTLQDKNIEAINQSLKRAFELFKKKFKIPHLVQAARDRLIPDVLGEGVIKADLVIEAIIEDKNAKQALFLKLEKEVKKETILATNTSTIPLEEISEVLADPKRLVGIHFFNPVAMMQLVEVVKGEKTDESIFNKALAFVGKIDKLPIPVQSKPGFLVNRLLMPYLMESFLMLEEGISMTVIDEVAMEFGMPMGPIELADTVGLDVCQFAGESLARYFGGEVPNSLRKMVQVKRLGKKNNWGFYQYKNGKLVKPKEQFQVPTDSDLCDRLILRILNEAVACLREGVVSETDWIDAGMIFGAGFAPFRGGPMNYIWTEGKDKILQRMQKLASRYGDRFKPDSGWSSLLVQEAVGGVSVPTLGKISND